jgi:hypothetical protein
MDVDKTPFKHTENFPNVYQEKRKKVETYTVYVLMSMANKQIGQAYL